MTKKPVHKEPVRNFNLINGPHTIEGVLWTGTSACLLDDKDTGFVCVITAPDKEQLDHFWKQLTSVKIKEYLCKSTIGVYKAGNDSEIPAKKAPNVWVLDNKKDSCYITDKKEKYDRGIQELGEANRCTDNECKILLRKLGWSREEIEDMRIGGVSL